MNLCLYRCVCIKLLNFTKICILVFDITIWSWISTISATKRSFTCAYLVLTWFYLSFIALIMCFYPRPVLAFGYCRCLRLSVCPSVRVCGNHLLVRAITHHPFKLGSPNLNHGCKRPWLWSLFVFLGIDLDLQGQIELQSKKLPHFELVDTITHHLFRLGSPNVGQRCKIPGLRFLLILGLIGLNL